ncbi:MAG: autotransporter-associated beta strand repeat-containing protein, partial [bacterium]
MTKKYRMADITLTAGTPDRCARHHNHQRPSAALRSAGRWLGLFALLALAQAGLATTITYSSYVATNSADTSWVSPAGAVSLQGFNYGGDDTSYGEVTWADCTNPNGGGAACGNNQTSPFTTYFSVPGVWGNNHTGFYPSGPALLNTGAWSSRTDCKLDIYGFTVGKHYRVQFVVADDRSDGYGRAVTIKGADSIAGQDSAAVQYGYMNGQYAVVTADFVADETGYHFFPEASSGGGTQINAVQILEVSGFAVTYNGNGNTGGTVPVDGSSPYASNVVVTVLGNINGLVRVGGSFTNWNTTATGTGTGYNSGDTFNITNNITLYAQWLALPSQTLTWTAAVDNNWDESTANWTNNAGYNLWLNNSINPDSAIFDAQGAGTVNVAFANTFYASNLTFNAAGYTISGGTLTLGNTPILTVNSNVTISSILAGSGGLTKTGNGTLILSSANSYAGGTTVNGGTLELGASG